MESRDDIIRRMFSDGQTLASIGNVLNISRERVRQIAKQIGIVPGKLSRKRRSNVDFERVRVIEPKPDKTYCRTDIEIVRIKEMLNYDPNTGIWIWRANGSIATYLGPGGYFNIKLDGKIFMAHDLVWPYLFDRWPRNVIDHANRIESDNRFINLREATQLQNLGNSEKRKHNKSGYKGVHWDKIQKRWRAEIAHIKLGSFSTVEEAAAVYAKAAKIRYGEFAHTNWRDENCS